MTDNDVLDLVRESLSGVHMHTPVEMIMAKASARRRRRLTALAVGAATTVVAVTAGLLATVGTSQTAPPASPRTAQLVAFSVATGPNGGSTLILRKGAQYRLDPAALAEALARRGIPALVNVGRMCDSAPEPSGLDQVISSRRLADGSVYTTFNARAMPAGSKVSIGYFATGTQFALIEDGAPLHCTTNPNPGSQSNTTGDGPHTQPITPGQPTTP